MTSTTLLLPATRQEPSEARLIERIGMSPAGVCTAISSLAARREMNTYKLVRADVLRQIPLLNPAGLVARDQLSLIRVHHDIVDCAHFMSTAPPRDVSGRAYQEPRYHNFGASACFCTRNMFRKKQ